MEELKESFFERLLSLVDDVSAANQDFHDRARACVTTYVATAAQRPHHYAAAFSSIPTPEEVAARRHLTWEDFIRTSKGQAFTSDEATLMTGKSNSTHMSTEGSSKGVAIGMHPTFLISATIRAKSSRSILVASVFLM